MNDISIFIYGVVVGIVAVGGLVFLIHTLRKQSHPSSLLPSPPLPPSFSIPHQSDASEIVFVHADLNVSTTAQQHQAWGSLPPRQKQAAVLIASGMSTRQVAAEMQIQLSTVQGYLKETYAALDIRSRTELANFVRDIALENAPPTR